MRSLCTIARIVFKGAKLIALVTLTRSLGPEGAAHFIFALQMLRDRFLSFMRKQPRV